MKVLITFDVAVALVWIYALAVSTFLAFKGYLSALDKQNIYLFHLKEMKVNSILPSLCKTKWMLMTSQS